MDPHCHYPRTRTAHTTLLTSQTLSPGFGGRGNGIRPCDTNTDRSATKLDLSAASQALAVTDSWFPCRGEECVTSTHVTTGSSAQR